MFNGFTQETIDFMWELRMNNNKVWFEENKERFKRCFEVPLKALAGDVFEKVMAEFGERGFVHKVSRIYRDARRVRDGEPYKTSMWFVIEKPVDDWSFVPVFWFDIYPDGWSYGLGYYHAKPVTMAKLRARIERDPEGFERFVAPIAGQGEFVLGGEEYKRVKQAPSERVQGWFNRKNFSLSCHNEGHGDVVFSAGLVDRIVAGYRFLMPFYDYFITLDDDPEPR